LADKNAKKNSTQSRKGARTQRESQEEFNAKVQSRKDAKGKTGRSVMGLDRKRISPTP
jgi:hypothetical protein